MVRILSRLFARKTKKAEIDVTPLIALMELWGMLAVDIHRAHRGESLTYEVEDFRKVLDKYGIKEAKP